MKNKKVKIKVLVKKGLYRFILELIKIKRHTGQTDLQAIVRVVILSKRIPAVNDITVGKIVQSVHWVLFLFCDGLGSLSVLEPAYCNRQEHDKKNRKKGANTDQNYNYIAYTSALLTTT